MVAEDARRIMARLGFRTIDEMVGRSDVLHTYRRSHQALEERWFGSDGRVGSSQEPVLPERRRSLFDPSRSRFGKVARHDQAAGCCQASAGTW